MCMYVEGAIRQESAEGREGGRQIRRAPDRLCTVFDCVRWFSMICHSVNCGRIMVSLAWEQAKFSLNSFCVKSHIQL